MGTADARPHRRVVLPKCRPDRARRVLASGVSGLDVPVTAGSPAGGLDTGSQLGKRYTDGTIELLVTKAGAGTLAVDKTPLDIKGARPLPSSD